MGGCQINHLMRLGWESLRRRLLHQMLLGHVLGHLWGHWWRKHPESPMIVVRVSRVPRVVSGGQRHGPHAGAFVSLQVFPV